MQTRGGQGSRAAAPVSSWPVGVRGAGPVPKLVWRVKLVAELEPGVATETEVARIERDEEAGLVDLGLRLEEAKRLTAALQAEIVPAQVATVGERRRWCAACGQLLASKGHYRATFRSLFGEVPVRVRRLLVCPCHGPGEPKSFAALDLGGGTVAPELAYVTARYAALAQFGKVAALLSELLPIGGAANAGTVRNRTQRVSKEVVQPPVAAAAPRRYVEHVMGMPISLALRGRHTDDHAARFAWAETMRVLHEVDRVFSTYRPDSFVSRLDRVAFLVGHAETAPDMAAAACERLRANIEAYPWSRVAEGLGVTVTIAMCANDDGRGDAPIQRALHALQAAQQRGRNQVTRPD